MLHFGAGVRIRIRPCNRTVRTTASGGVWGTTDSEGRPTRMSAKVRGLSVSTKHVDVIERSVEQAHIWINGVADRFDTDDPQLAYGILRALLHALRDRITVEESAQLAAQLPVLIRGIYYEGWRPTTRPQSYDDSDTFLRRVADEALLAGTTEASYGVTAAAGVLREHVSEGELEDILAILPAELRHLLAATG